VASALFAVYLALRLAPFEVSANDIDDALAMATTRPLSRFSAESVVYLKASPTLVPKLQREHPAIRLMPWTARPDDHGCDAKPGTVVMAPCLRADFVSAEIVSFPTSQTAIAAVGTSNSGGQLILLKIGGHWHIVIDHSYVL
jgi:hypothetical protein